MMRFLICSPPYSDKSGGVRVLFYLAEILQNFGYSVYMINLGEQINESDYMNSKNLKYFREDITSEDIVIYPEIITNNFLNAKNVVRYLLNRPMYINAKPINYGDDDLLISYSKLFDPYLYELFILLDDRHLFYPPDDWEDKQNIACMYFGKGRTIVANQQLNDLLSQFDQVIQITREFPADRRELAEVMRNSKLFVTFDSISAISCESLLCGTPVYFVDDYLKLCEFNGDLKNYGAFNSVVNYENAIDQVSLFQLEFEMNIQRNVDKIKDFAQMTINYFNTINEFKHNYPDLYKQFISFKKSKNELDNYRYLQYLTRQHSIYV